MLNPFSTDLLQRGGQKGDAFTGCEERGEHSSGATEPSNRPSASGRTQTLRIPDAAQTLPPPPPPPQLPSHCGHLPVAGRWGVGMAVGVKGMDRSPDVTVGRSHSVSVFPSVKWRQHTIYKLLLGTMCKS